MDKTRLLELLVKKVKQLPIHEHINRWVEEEEGRSRVALARKGMNAEVRRKALAGLKARVATRTNIAGRPGETHYLLHRSFGDDEAQHLNPEKTFYNNIGKKRLLGGKAFNAYSSWGPNVVVPGRGRTHIVSAWVPESKISFMPKAYISHPHLSDATRSVARHEDEIIVHPGKFHIHHASSGDDAKFFGGDHKAKNNKILEDRYKADRSFAHLPWHHPPVPVEDITSEDVQKSIKDSVFAILIKALA